MTIFLSRIKGVVGTNDWASMSVAWEIIFNFHACYFLFFYLIRGDNNFSFNSLVITNFFHYQIWFYFTTDRREGVKSNSDSKKVSHNSTVGQVILLYF